MHLLQPTTWVLLFAICLTAPLAKAQDDAGDVPSPKSVLGYEIGTRVTNYAGMQKYLRVLADSSDKVITGSYGQDEENNELLYLVISSATHIRDLDRIRAQTARLTDPGKTGEQQAAKIAAEIPATLFLTYGTDGDETGGLEAALLTAHHLASANDEHTAELLDKAVIVIVPMMNPSSHERMAIWTNTFSTKGGNKDAYAMEHNPPWGMGTNYNHYLVDLNRESVWATQKESQALQTLYYKWNPVVFIDHHGEHDNFTGPGYEEPLNPLYDENIRQWYKRYQDAIQERFGQHGWSYTPWETGSFYPGFWESLPTLNGAIGMTFETIGGGYKGLRYQRDSDGSVITLRLAADQHFHATMAVVDSTVQRKTQMLQSFYAYWAAADELHKNQDEKAFIIEPGRDPARTALLIDTLLRNQIEVYQTDAELDVKEVEDYFGTESESVRVAPGTYIVPANQPRASMLLTLLTRDFTVPQETIDASNERFERYQEDKSQSPNEFYDTTAWSMPLTFGVKAYWTTSPLATAGMKRVIHTTPARIELISRPASYGYCVDGGSNQSMALLIDLIQRDVKVVMATEDFAVDGKTFVRGSYVIRSERNKQTDLQTLLNELAEKHHIQVHSLSSSNTDSGPHLGSPTYVGLKKSRVAVLAGDPVSETSYGNTWFLLEKWYGLEFTPVYVEQLVVDRYQVIVMPDGDYDDLEKDFAENIAGWVERGGVLVCLGAASDWAAEHGLCSTRLQPEKWPTDPDAESWVDTVGPPGVILRANVNPSHYLSLGYADQPIAVRVDSGTAFEFEQGVQSPVVFSDPEDIHLSGFYYQSSLDRLSGTPYITQERIGDGHVVLFLQDPNFRLYWHGLTRLFLNSVVLSPSF